MGYHVFMALSSADKRSRDKGKGMTRQTRKLFAALLLWLVAAVVANATDTVTYVYTDPQGTPLAEADSSGNITATFDYTPYGTVAMGSPPTGLGYTGHVNDAETNLVYMQHRYYDSATGRFLSTDAAPPIAGELSYMNRYAYVGNNPITRDDPSGDYICNGSTDNCRIIRQGIKDVQRARAKLPPGSQGQQLLQKVLAFYGKEGENNGVTVNFGSDPKIVGETNTVGKTTEITFNVANLRANGKYPGTSLRAEVAATAAHEGQHGIDGQFFGRPINHAEWYVTENNAYITESYVSEGLNATSPYGLWHHGWQENATTNELRVRSAAENARDEVYKTQMVAGQ
jgi:RHS repeat-associated protein